MKKILFATSALVATAGVASADVSLSGDARMGVFYNQGGDMEFISRTRAKITLSGESDNGLSFGGSFDVHNASNASKGLSGSAYVSGTFGKISMGDVDGAAKAAVGNIDGIGLAGLGDGHELLYLNAGTDADGDGVQDTIYPFPAALFEFTTGSFTLYAGAGSPDGEDLVIATASSVVVGGIVLPGVQTIIRAKNTYSVGAKWASNGYSIAGAFETIDAAISSDSGATFTNFVTLSQYVIGASAEFGDFTVKANYGHVEGGNAFGSFDQYGISGTYAMDALSVTAYYAHKGNGNGIDTYGLGGAYDLGGGLSVKGGVANLDGTTIADLGISMSF